MANESGNKKWYSYFITVESDNPGTGPSDSGDAARAIADIAASLETRQPPLPAPLNQKPATPPTQAPAPAPAPSAPTGKTLSFDEIYEAAGISAPTHGYSILKVANMLESPHIQALPAEVKKSSVMVALDAAGVKVQEVVEDAIRRDKALDAFERVQQKQLEDLEAQKLEENRKLQAEIDKLTAEYKAKIQANNDSVAKSKDGFHRWRADKQKLEQKISDTVSCFVTENPITTAAPRPPK